MQHVKVTTFQAAFCTNQVLNSSIKGRQLNQRLSYGIEKIFSPAENAFGQVISVFRVWLVGFQVLEEVNDSLRVL